MPLFASARPKPVAPQQNPVTDTQGGPVPQNTSLPVSRPMTSPSSVFKAPNYGYRPQPQTQPQGQINVPPPAQPPNPRGYSGNDFWGDFRLGTADRGRSDLGSIVGELSPFYPGLSQTGEDTLLYNGQEYDVNSAQGDWLYNFLDQNGGPNPLGDSSGLVDLLMSRLGQQWQPTQQQSALRGQLESSLMDFINQNRQPVDPASIHGSPEAQAFQLQNQRNSEYLRSAMAERLGAEGLGNVESGGGSGAFDSQLAGIQQSQAEGQSQYEAQLAHQILTDRADRLQAALQMGAGYLSDQQRLEMQQQLQQTQAGLDLARLRLGNQQFYDQLGFNIGSKEADLNQGGAASLFG